MVARRQSGQAMTEFILLLAMFMGISFVVYNSFLAGGQGGAIGRLDTNATDKIARDTN